MRGLEINIATVALNSVFKMDSETGLSDGRADSIICTGIGNCRNQGDVVISVSAAVEDLVPDLTERWVVGVGM
jgi:hypothetical protein